MQKGAYDKAARPLNSLIVGENVLFDRFDPLKKKAIWDHGVITDVCEKCRRSYMVRVSNGTECRRTRIHIKPSSAPVVDDTLKVIVDDGASSENHFGNQDV